MKFAMHKATLSLSSSPQHSPINFSLDTQTAKDEARNYSQAIAALSDPSS